MKYLYTYIFLIFTLISIAQNPTPALVGYWHNWDITSAPYVPLNKINSNYNYISIAFAVPAWGTDYKMEFNPEKITKTEFINGVKELQNQGKKVIISIGGATAPIKLDNTNERDTFILTMNNLISTYGFDGIDIDFEGSSLSVSGGNISSPIDASINNLIYAIKQIMGEYRKNKSKKLILTMAPETAFVQGGMAAYGGIWGAYLPVIHALRDSLEILQVQLYNSGSMVGLDGKVYTQGTADFILSMTEAVIKGFNTTGGFFEGIPANKIAIALPACPSAAGGGFTKSDTVISAIKYLMGNGNKPGSYTLMQSGGYKNLRGMMTWSINWDAVNTCNLTSHEYASTFSKIFGNTSAEIPVYSLKNNLKIYPNPAKDIVNIYIDINNFENNLLVVYNSIGKAVLSQNIFSNKTELNISCFPKGVYYIKFNNTTNKFLIE